MIIGCNDVMPPQTGHGVQHQYPALAVKYANPVIGAHHIQQTAVSIFRYVLYAVATNYNAPPAYLLALFSNSCGAKLIKR